MKRFLSFLLTLLAFVSSTAGIRLLTITVADYPKDSEWGHISADNDRDIMLRQFQGTADITSLSENQATYTNIINSLSALEGGVSKGDTVIVHFSGHGQQIVALNNSDEPDGLDEALIPYDVYKKESAGYHGENHLRDDVFGIHLDCLRKAVGPHGLVIAIIDACHSDSMNKGVGISKNDIVRGTYEIFGLTDNEFAAFRNRYRNQDTTPLSKSPDASPLVIVSACRSDQINHEIKVGGKGYGSLTYYFVQALKTKSLKIRQNFLTGSIT